MMTSSQRSVRAVQLLVLLMGTVPGWGYYRAGYVRPPRRRAQTPEELPPYSVQEVDTEEKETKAIKKQGELTGEYTEPSHIKDHVEKLDGLLQEPAVQVFNVQLGHRVPSEDTSGHFQGGPVRGAAVPEQTAPVHQVGVKLNTNKHFGASTRIIDPKPDDSKNLKPSPDDYDQFAIQQPGSLTGQQPAGIQQPGSLTGQQPAGIHQQQHGGFQPLATQAPGEVQQVAIQPPGAFQQFALQPPGGFQQHAMQPSGGFQQYLNQQPDGSYPFANQQPDVFQHFANHQPDDFQQFTNSQPHGFQLFTNQQPDGVQPFPNRQPDDSESFANQQTDHFNSKFFNNEPWHGSEQSSSEQAALHPPSHLKISDVSEEQDNKRGPLWRYLSTFGENVSKRDQSSVENSQLSRRFRTDKKPASEKEDIDKGRKGRTRKAQEQLNVRDYIDPFPYRYTRRAYPWYNYPSDLEYFQEPETCTCNCNSVDRPVGLEEVTCEWKMVFKAVAGNGRVVYDDFLLDPIYVNGHNTEAQDISSDLPFKHPDILQKWSELFISQVEVEIFSEGVRRAWFLFDGTGTDKQNWMSQDRLIASSYDSIKTDSLPFFSTHHSELERSFAITHPVTTCASICGYMEVIDSVTLVSCPHVEHAPVPYFLYSATPEGPACWESEGDYGIGDRFVISAKVCPIGW